jgi:hypothetical protein
MESVRAEESASRFGAKRSEETLQPDEVAAMVRLHELGWGAKRLAREFGCARNTVRSYLGGAGRRLIDSLCGGLRSRVRIPCSTPAPSSKPSVAPAPA